MTDLTSLCQWFRQDFIPSLDEQSQNFSNDRDLLKKSSQELFEKGFFKIFDKDPMLLREKQALFFSLMRELSRHQPSLAVFLSFQMIFGQYFVSKYGTTDQKNKYIEAIQSGALIVSAAWTEDVSGYKTQLIHASLEEPSMLLNGKKEMITNLPIAGLVLYICKREQEKAEPETILVLMDTKNLQEGITSQRFKKGLSGLTVGRLALDEYVVEKEEVVVRGEQADQILEELMTLYEWVMSFISLGIAEGLWQESLEYSQAPRGFGTRLIEVPLVQMNLTSLYSDIRLGQSFVDQIVHYHKGEPEDVTVFKVYTGKLLYKSLHKVEALIPNFASQKEEKIYKLYLDGHEMLDAAGSIDTHSRKMVQRWL